jgi:hypothetical protein
MARSMSKHGETNEVGSDRSGGSGGVPAVQLRDHPMVDHVSMISVIGHGRSPENKGWAERIDGSRFVIRMWDWNWQKPSDYGTRYDYGVLEMLPGITEVFWRDNKLTPAIGWLAYDRYERTRKVRRLTGNPYGPRPELETVTITVPEPLVPEGTIVIDQSWRDFAWSLGGRGEGGRALNLTRGCAAACWALAHGAERGEDVVLVGFDNLAAGRCLPTDDAFPAEYLAQYDKQYPRWRSNWYTPGLSTCGTHDIAIERTLLKYVATQNRTKLCFAQDVWQ